MTNTPAPEEVYEISGPENETLFWQAKVWLVGDKANIIQQYLDETWEHYGGIRDDRLLVLVGALCIESGIDSLLLSIAPAFSEFRENTDFKFSLKINMARSLRLIPSRILTSCDLVRQIRNEFAHKLEYKQFAQLDPKKYLNKLQPYLRAYNASSAERNKQNHRELFHDLVGLSLLALKVYTEQVAQLRSWLETEDAFAAFKRWAEQSRDRQA